MSIPIAFAIAALFLLVSCNGDETDGEPGDGTWDVSLQTIKPKNGAPEKAEIALIFVHGLDGHYQETFQNSTTKEKWFDKIFDDNQDLGYGRQLLQFHMYSVDYRSAFSSSLSTTELVSHVFEAIEAEDIFKNYTYLWFVTHSLGGIITKKIIDYYDNKPRHLRKILGVSLLGVPSQGSKVAEDADKIDFMIELFGQNYKLIEDLRPAKINSFLEDTEDNWHRLLKEHRRGDAKVPRIYCAYEKDPIFAGIVVVPELFTSTICDDSPKAIDADHIDMVKPPASGQWQTHFWLRRTIKETLSIVERSDAVSASVEGPFSDFVERMKERYDKVDRDLLRLVEIKVDYVDDISEENAKSLVLPHKQYSGPTWRRIIERIAKDNEEIEIAENATDGRHIVLQVRKPKN